MISVLISKVRTPEEQTAYLAELRSWLEGERDTPVEEMSSFFAHRLDQYEGVHLAHWAAEYEALADYLPDGLSTLLDIGCGTGLELASLLRRFPDLRVTGIDLSAPMLEKLRQNYPSSQVEIICADYFSYPFEGRQYDAALSFETLHHFPYQKRGKSTANSTGPSAAAAAIWSATIWPAARKRRTSAWPNTTAAGRQAICPKGRLSTSTSPSPSHTRPNC